MGTPAPVDHSTSGRPFYTQPGNRTHLPPAAIGI